MAEAHPTMQSLSDQLAAGQTDPVTLVETAMTHAEQADSVFTRLLHDRALFEAEQSFARQKAGVRLGPMDGIPIAWKDVFDVRGEITTVGSRVFTQPAEIDAESLRRASQAGLIPLGKTNMTELAFSGLGMNPHFGTPHHTPGTGPARVPGGSSSGSAVAVAKGIVAAATGSDTAGSLRIPAAFNGLYSYRPTVGRLPMAGVRPLARSLDTIGAMARRLDDCLRLTEAMRSGRATLPRPQSRETLTLILDEEALDQPLISEPVRNSIREVALRLEENGVRLVRRPVPAAREVLKLIDRYGWLGGYEALAEYKKLLQEHPVKAFDPRVRNRILAVADLPPERPVILYRERLRLQHELVNQLEGACLLSPTVAHCAPELAPLLADDERYAATNLATLKLTMVASFLDSPAVALPVGTDANGQHLSVQLSAPQQQDDALLRAALAVAALTGSFS